MADYEVIDNFLPEQEFNHIAGIIMGKQFAWHFLEDVAEKNVKSFKIPAKTSKTLYSENIQDDWFVQIGAFKNRLNAHKAARNARNTVPEQLGNLPASLSKITKTNNTNNNLEYLWRVRFIELAENQARSVCAELWSSGLSCIPLPSNNNS